VKRDMELVRKLLLFLEEKPDHVVLEKVELEGYDDSIIGDRLILLVEAGYEAIAIKAERCQRRRCGAAAIHR
jgi:Hypothetical protein (DUF2513)